MHSTKGLVQAREGRGSSNPPMTGKLKAGVFALVFAVSHFAAGPASALSLFVGGSLIDEVDPVTGASLGAPFASVVGSLGGMAFSPSGSLYIGDSLPGGLIVEVDPITGAPIGASFPSPMGFPVGGLGFSPSGSLFIGDSFAGIVTEVDPVTGAPIGAFFGSPFGGVGGISFSPSGALYIASGGVLSEFDPLAGGPVGPLLPLAFPVGGIAFSPSGTLYIADPTGALIAEIDPITGAPLGPMFPATIGAVGGLAFVSEPTAMALLIASLAGLTLQRRRPSNLRARAFDPPCAQEGAGRVGLQGVLALRPTA